MSLINQMLKDLDSRRGPMEESRISALEGMYLVNNDRLNWYNSLFFAAWAIAGLLAIVVSYQLTTRWNGRAETEHAIATPAVKIMAEPEPQAQLDTESIHEQLNVAAVVASAKIGDPPEEAQSIPILPPAEPLQAVPLSASQSFIKPVSILTPEQKAGRLFAKAQQALFHNQQQLCELLLRQVLEENPRHVAARSQLAALQIRMQQEVKAEQLLADGLLIEPHQLSLARPYSQLLAARGQLVPALQALDRAIGRRQADAETLALQAAILYRLERHSESAAAYRKAVRIQPNRALWWTGLAVALEQDGHSKQALDAFQQAAELPLKKPLEDYVKQRIHVLSDKDFHD